jgi:putative ABC transport system permease protein
VQENPQLVSEIATIGWQDVQLSTVQQVLTGKQTPTQDMLLRACDDVFFANTAMHLQARATGYATDQQVEDAVQQQTGLAMLYPFPGYKLYHIAPGFQPFTMNVTDTQTPGVTHQVTVIGILPQTWQWPGLFVSTRTGAQIFTDPHMHLLWYLFRLKPGVNGHQARLALGAAFGAKYGMEPVFIGDMINHAVGFLDELTTLLTGYLALGLVIGVAGLGIISSRAVVERRQQIGMLRALGYSRRSVQAACLLESGFVALLGLIVGTVLGSWTAGQAADALYSRNAFVGFQPPFITLTVILVGAYLTTLCTTYVPARAAARVRPAEALRYE